MLEAARCADITPVRVKSIELIAQGSRLGVEQISRALADPHAAVPSLIRGTMTLLVEEIRLLELRIAQLERELTVLARQ